MGKGLKEKEVLASLSQKEGALLWKADPNDTVTRIADLTPQEHPSLTRCSKVFLAEFRDAFQNLLFPGSRGRLEAVDVASQERSAEAVLLGQAAYVDFRMSKEEVLEAGGFGIGGNFGFMAVVWNPISLQNTLNSN